MSPPSSSGRSERVLQASSPTLRDIHELVGDRLLGVEAMFRENLASPLAIVAEIGEYVSNAEGKRVRPTLHLLCASMCGYRGPNDVLLATVLEYIHSATLIHDDIIDEATTRRGRPSVNANWDNSITVLFGDYMFAKAMEIALRAGSLEIMRRLADTTLRMTEGEMLQTRYAGRLDLTAEEHLDIVARKTAALFSCCCEIAGLLAGVDRSRMNALTAYGRKLGMVFQIVDDVLDFTGNQATLGKPAASDLREGKMTLPVIDLLATDPGPGRDLVRRIMEQGRPDMPEIDVLRRMLEDSGALLRSHQRAREFAASAAADLECFDDSPARRSLMTLPELLLLRER